MGKDKRKKDEYRDEYLGSNKIINNVCAVIVMLIFLLLVLGVSGVFDRFF
jgi:hypothetical protein